MNGLILLLACIFFSAGASIFLKLGTISLVEQFEILSLIKNPLIWIGGMC